MGFIEAVKKVFSHYADFSGRARRSEYWYFCLFNMLVSIVLQTVGAIIAGLFAGVGIASGASSDTATVMGSMGNLAVSGLASLYSLAVLVPSIAVAVRRLHDIGKSGWYYLFSFIPCIGQILLIVWFCQDSEPGSNEWGDNPKEYPDYSKTAEF